MCGAWGGCAGLRSGAEVAAVLGTIVTRLSFLTLQRGNAVLDAPRPGSGVGGRAQTDQQAVKLILDRMSMI
ncbi:DUF1534 domain-containing protein [Pseudomonas syringae]|nr:DUF1534 domain-containing protein [Pseudomonas syringae]